MDVASSSVMHAKVKQEVPYVSLKFEDTKDCRAPLERAEHVERKEFSSDASLPHDQKPDEPCGLEVEPGPQPKDSDNSTPEENSLDHPKKQTRLILDCVLVWTWADLQRQKKKDAEMYSEMMKTIKNPKIKKGVKEIGLQPSTIRSRLEPIGFELFDIQLEKHLIDTLVPRNFLSDTYGGNSRALHPRIAQKFLNVHGYNDWMYLVTEFHPDAPQVPGAPGICLWFYGDGDGWHEGRMRVFTRVQTSPNLWQYMGMYESKMAAPLTQEEWAEQTSLVRMTWASRIASSDWGKRLSARIRARRDLGREPTQRDVENILDSFKVGEAASARQVEAAYLAGEETMSVYTMKCVGYDYDFQRGLCEKFQNWAPQGPKPRKQKTAKMKREYLDHEYET